MITRAFGDDIGIVERCSSIAKQQMPQAEFQAANFSVRGSIFRFFSQYGFPTARETRTV